MVFYKEHTGYKYHSFSDLQITWSCLRDAVVSLTPSDVKDRLLFSIDEAMRCESVCDLPRMRNAFLIIKAIVQQENLMGELLDWIDDLYVLIDEIFEAIPAGEKY